MRGGAGKPAADGQTVKAKGPSGEGGEGTHESLAERHSRPPDCRQGGPFRIPRAWRRPLRFVAHQRAERVKQLGLFARLDGKEDDVHLFRVLQVDARVKEAARDAFGLADDRLDKGLERDLDQLVDLVVHVLVVDHALGAEDVVPDGPAKLNPREQGR